MITDQDEPEGPGSPCRDSPGRLYGDGPGFVGTAALGCPPSASSTLSLPDAESSWAEPPFRAAKDLPQNRSRASA